MRELWRSFYKQRELDGVREATADEFSRHFRARYGVDDDDAPTPFGHSVLQVM